MNLLQHISQLEQDLKDCDDEKERKDISRHIRNTKLIIQKIRGMSGR